MTGCYATYSCIEYPNQLWDSSDPNNPVYLGIALGNISGDPNNPLFVDAGDNNYHLDPNSPCIDAGKGMREISRRLRLGLCSARMEEFHNGVLEYDGFGPIITLRKFKDVA